MSSSSGTILISGGTSGIGRATVLYFLSAGWRVITFGRRAEAIASLQLESQDAPGELCAFAWDLEQRDWADFEHHLHIYGIDRVDALVNNAGLLIKKPFLELSRVDIESSFAVNIIGVMELIQKVVPLMPENTSILNISTMGGVQGSVKFPQLSAYGSSKSALIALTELLAVELEPHKIRVNVLALGAVNTLMLQEAFPGFEASAQPEDLAAYIFSMVTDHGNLFNGKTLQVSSSTP